MLNVINNGHVTLRGVSGKACRSPNPYLSAPLSFTSGRYRRSVWPTITCGFSSSPRCGAKTRTTVRLEDLPQGVLPRDNIVESDGHDAPAYPTVIQQARNNMRKFESCVLLTRVGSFYEMYFEQAEKYAPLLNIKLAEKRTSVGAVPMTAFLKILIQDLDQIVAISEEFANDTAGKTKSGGLLFDRKVTRIVTPGTLVDEKFINPYAHNFLLAICTTEADHVDQGSEPRQAEYPIDRPEPEPNSDAAIGLAWVDLSTGEFFTQITSLAALSSAIVRIGAKEIIMSEGVGQATKLSILDILGNSGHVLTWCPKYTITMSISNWTPMLESAVPVAVVTQFTAPEVAAGSVLLEYVKDRLQRLDMKLQAPIKRNDDETLSIDKNTMKGLEILETSKDAVKVGKGSLFHAIRRTNTKSGSRLLRDRITSPSTSLDVINQRLDLAQLVIEDAYLREDLIELLKHTYDSQRLVQKFSLGRGDADDLVCLYRTIVATQRLADALKTANLKRFPDSESSDSSSVLTQLLNRLCLDGPIQLASRIAQAIDEDSLLASHTSAEAETAAMVEMAHKVVGLEGNAGDLAMIPQSARTKSSVRLNKPADTDEQYPSWIMRRNASPPLNSLHEKLTQLQEEKLALGIRLRSETGSSSLTLRWTPGLGHICHVKGAKDVKLSTDTLGSARNASTSKSTRSFYLPEWSKLGGQVDQVRFQISAEEQNIFRDLRENVIKNLVRLRRNASVLDELDVACSSALLAIEQSLVRPILNDSHSHRIIAGRHPTVKPGLEEQGRSFISNDCFVGDKYPIWLITGPNMAGKSTFLRQNALISILAQTGSFVPAEHAEIGMVDKIFSRIGAADDLYRDQSTFMVEMLETANILQQATSRSFVIMDEVGRGTTPEDGVAVGYACLHHLYNINKCRTLFATHFHKLADMTTDWQGMGTYCTDIVEYKNGTFSYDHRLRTGVNRKSHALKVARLAGIPETAIDVASQILARAL